MNAKHAIEALKMTAAQAINDALDRRRRAAHPDYRPHRVFLGEHAYKQLHMEAAVGGIECEMFPQFEDDRLEYKGMKIHCQRSAQIEFE